MLRRTARTAPWPARAAAVLALIPFAAVRPAAAQMSAPSDHRSSIVAITVPTTLTLPAFTPLTIAPPNATAPAAAPAPAAARPAAAFRVAPVATVLTEDSALAAVLPDPATAAAEGRFIVVNLNARRLWYVEGDTVRFAADIAVGRGTRANPSAAPGAHATPRTRFTVLRKDSVPVWVPPDWHFREVAAKGGRSLHHLRRGESLTAADGSVLFVQGDAVMRRQPDGRVQRVALTDQNGRRRELVVDGRVIVPPEGTTQRAYPAVLGPRRLAFRDGFAIHGTDKPESIGKAASHGCLRMRNDEIVALYDLVAVGTPVIVR